MTRAVFRFVNYTTLQDQTVEPGRTRTREDRPGDDVRHVKRTSQDRVVAGVLMIAAMIGVCGLTLGLLAYLA